MLARLIPFCLALVAPLCAQLALGRPFGDHMVLQRDKQVVLWGTAAPNAPLTLSFGGVQHGTVCDAEGKWRLALPPSRADANPRELELRTPDTTLIVHDVLVGDVWICSGQSNMEWSIAKTDAHDALEVANKLAKLRLFGLSRTRDLGAKDSWKGLLPETYFAGAWQPCSERTVRDFSAVAFWFGRDLVERLDVPIGLVMNAIGGSPTEAWVPREVLTRNERFAPLVTKWPAGCVPNDWVLDMVTKGLAGWTPPAKPDPAAIPPHPFAPGFLYEAGMRWLEPCAVRGFLWYQGESNVQDVAMGEDLFFALVTSWRSRFAQGDLPFLWTQLTSYDPGNPATSAGWVEYRDRQRSWLAKVSSGGMAVTLDIGDEKDIHPKNKRDVGRRLARQALAVAYGRTDVESSGPLFAGVERDGDELVVRFTHADGLAAGESVLDLEVANADGAWSAAKAKVVGETLRVTAGATVRALRYGFTPFSKGNLRNGAGLPASPFRAELGQR